MLENLLLDRIYNSTVSKNIEQYEQFGDIGTTDFLIKVIQKHEKMA
jgi:DNA-binding ferritin-like protein